MQQRLTGDTLRLCRATLAAAKYDVATREMFAAVQGCMLAVVLLLSCFSELFSRAFLVAGCLAQCVYICE